MSLTYHCLPTDVWCFDASTPKGYYLNLGVFRFGRMVQSDMDQAEAQARKNRKGKNADRLANAARLGVLGKHLKEDIKRFRDPAKSNGVIKDDPNKPKEESVGDEVKRWKI